MKINPIPLRYPLRTAGRSLWAALLLVGLLGAGSAVAQDRQSLEAQKQENLHRIEEAKSILADTRSQKQASLGQLSALNQQIRASQQLINTLRQEVTGLAGEMSQMDDLINALESDLEQLKEEYGRMVYSAHKANQNVNRLTFLFASRDFNQFWQRLVYMEQYSEARTQQVRQIAVVQQSLTRQQTRLRAKQQEQRELLAEQLQQRRALSALKNEQSSMVSELSSREAQLRKELKQREQALERLDALIADLVRREEEARKASNVPTAPEVAALSASFQENAGNLPWPVGSGFISQRFGRQPHPVLKGIVVNNEGVDIQTNKGESIRAVFEGTVTTVAFVPGMNSVVIVKHGDYYSLYAKLEDVKVSKGQRVKLGDTLGQVHTNPEGVSEVQFQIWKNFDKLNPERWLAKR